MASTDARDTGCGEGGKDPVGQSSFVQLRGPTDGFADAWKPAGRMLQFGS